MPGIIQQGEVGALELASEFADLVLHRAFVQILAFDHVEAEFAQGSRDIGGVIRWIGKLIGVAIPAVADHKRYAAADRDRDGGGRNRRRARRRGHLAVRWGKLLFDARNALCRFTPADLFLVRV